MKHSVLICARREANLLRLLANGLFAGGAFPDFLCSEVMGHGTVRIRLELDCEPAVIAALRAGWAIIHGVQSLVVTPLDDLEPTVPDSPAAATD